MDAVSMLFAIVVFVSAGCFILYIIFFDNPNVLYTLNRRKALRRIREAVKSNLPEVLPDNFMVTIDNNILFYGTGPVDAWVLVYPNGNKKFIVAEESASPSEAFLLARQMAWEGIYNEELLRSKLQVANGRS